MLIFATEDKNSWFYDMNKDQQDLYITRHPNSKFAKQASPEQGDADAFSTHILDDKKVQKATQPHSKQRKQAANSVTNQGKLIEDYYSKLPKTDKLKLDSFTKKLSNKEKISKVDFKPVKTFFNKYQKWVKGLDSEKIGKLAIKGAAVFAIGSFVAANIPLAALAGVVFLSSKFKGPEPKFLGPVRQPKKEAETEESAPKYTKSKPNIIDTEYEEVPNDEYLDHKQPKQLQHITSYFNIAAVDNTPQILVKHLADALQSHNFTKEQWQYLLRHQS